MTSDTLSSATATQLTFPWAMPTVDHEGTGGDTIVAERTLAPASHTEFPVGAVVNTNSPASQDVAPSLQAALEGDRIGRPFQMGSVMFRILKSYGITDEEITAGVAAYNARRKRGQV